MLRNLIALGALLTAVVGLVGCGSGVPSLSSKDLQAFADATPEVKQTWEKGLAADKANDYLTAGTAYFSLLSQNLPAEQNDAVKTALVAMNQRMYAAAAKGDEAAKKAVEALQNNLPRGR